MSLRARIVFYLVALHLLLGAMAFYALLDRPWLLLGAEVVFAASAVTGWWLVKSFFVPLDLIRTGSGLIRERDFSSRFSEVGQREMDDLIRIYNTMIDQLREERRKVEERKPPKPVLSDLRESGQIEQDADLVMFIYRDEYYDHESEREGIADLIIAKHRNGGLGTVELAFQKEFPRFMSYAGDDGY